MARASPPRPKLAILFRYGAGEHTHFLPALPELAEALSTDFEVHHFGFRGEEEIPEKLRQHAVIHNLPFRVRRRSETDKRIKALLWLLCLPLVGLHLTIRGFRVTFVDECVPLTASFLRTTYRRPLAFTIHDFFLDVYFPEGTRLNAPARGVHRIDLRAWRRMPRLFVRVEAAREYLAELGFDPNRIQVTRDPCDLELFAPGDRAAARGAWGFSDEDVVLVHHGVMHPNKGNDRVLRALARCRERLPQVKFLLIGEGPEHERLEDLVNELGLTDRVRMTGWLSSVKEVAAALNAADIGLVMRVGQAADHFHVTSTLVHNLACGLPVLAARLDGLSEVVTEGREALLFDPACGGEFEEALTRLASDAKLRAKMGQAARETAAHHFNRQKIAEELAEGLRSLCL